MSGQAIDREGIFRVRAETWKVRRADNSKSVAISFRFAILEQLDGQEWHDWGQYGGYFVYGDFYVVKKDGTVNAKAVEQLSQSLGWDGSLRTVATCAPPDVVVQVKVEENIYNGRTTYRAAWMNPGDFVPTGGGEDEDSVRELDALFGSQLRAAAVGSGAKPAGRPPAPPRADRGDAIAPLPGDPLPPGEDTPF